MEKAPTLYRNFYSFLFYFTAVIARSAVTRQSSRRPLHFNATIPLPHVFPLFRSPSALCLREPTELLCRGQHSARA